MKEGDLKKAAADVDVADELDDSAADVEETWPSLAPTRRPAQRSSKESCGGVEVSKGSRPSAAASVAARRSSRRAARQRWRRRGSGRGALHQQRRHGGTEVLDGEPCSTSSTSSSNPIVSSTMANFCRVLDFWFRSVRLGERWLWIWIETLLPCWLAPCGRLKMTQTLVSDFFYFYVWVPHNSKLNPAPTKHGTRIKLSYILIPNPSNFIPTP